MIAVTTRARDYVFDPASGRLLVALGHTGLSYTQDLASDGSRLVTSHESEVLVWDLEGAAVAWSAKLDEGGQRQAVVYSMKVNNPRGDVEIASIDILPGLDNKGGIANRAVPAVLAITAGRILE